VRLFPFFSFGKEKERKVVIYAFKRTAYRFFCISEEKKKRDVNGRSKVLNLLPKRPLSLSLTRRGKKEKRLITPMNR
jgi:hypothetical protein